MSAPKRPTQSSQVSQGGDQSNNVKKALSDTVGIISRQVALLQEKSTKAPLTFEDARLLCMYNRALIMVSSEERSSATETSRDLGEVSNEDLEAMALDALKTLGKK